MVHLQAGQPNASLLRIADDLAQRFNAGLIGIAASRPMDVIYGRGYVPADMIQQNHEEVEAELKAAESEFRSAQSGRARFLDWRSSITYGSLSDYVAREARSADLLITAVDRNADTFDSPRHAEVGALVMQAGRPILLVPASVDKLDLEHVMVGWKDTRETHRAISDALPLLRKAARVTVVEIAPDDDLSAARGRLQDVLAWLGRHGVEAKSIASPSTGDDTKRFSDIAQEQKADLIVAGAYGHSRAREWVLGGFTHDLLLRGNRCALVSH
jgi:nucleotide-binding universal stress UspA family protein